MSACRTIPRFGFHLALLGVGVLTFFNCALALSAAEPPNDAPRQEPGLLGRIMNPDRTLRFEPSQRGFSGSGASPIREKSARARTFAFSRSATVSAYRTATFGGTVAHRTKAAGATKRSALAARPGSDGFATKDAALSSRESAARADRAAGQLFAARGATTASSAPRAFLVAGKRQGALDEQARARPMTIDEVRELLNKNR